MKIGLLISGELGLLILKELVKRHLIIIIFTNKESFEIINYAKQNKIKIFIGNPRNSKAKDIINSFKIELLLSVNYLFLIEKDLIDWPIKYALNIHGSLLPKYRGRAPHIWAIINNEKVTGITVHLIDKGCDTGNIIYQEKIEILPTYTGGDLLDIYKNRYPEIINNVIDFIELGQIKSKKQNESEATYFGKRTPEDGLINWNWQKERINNWIRALAFPYPGAYSFFNDDKIIINKIEYSETGFNSETENGMILSISDGIIVKTPNGAIKITEYQSKNRIHFFIGGILR